MKERPILFSAPMVRAILEGRKTQTRRAVKRVMLHEDHGPPIWDRAWIDGVSDNQYIKVQYGNEMTHRSGGTVQRHFCPYGVPGDRLWVRESFSPCVCASCIMKWPNKHADHSVTYRAGYVGNSSISWRSAIHMPRWASRITLEVVSVRVERVQEISEADAKSEGVIPALPVGDKRWVEGFRRVWELINDKGSWESNPWVWVIEFGKVT